VNLVRIRPAADPSAPGISPGRIDGRGYVAAADRFLEILEIQPSSKRIMTWAEYVNGRQVKAGDRFTSAAT
jgi:methionyl-tRNA formyltransferase